MKRTRTAGGVIIHERTGKVLVVSQNGDSWSLPKGHVERGESDLETAEREIEEESGITRLTFVRELGSYERHGIGYGGQGERTDEMKTIVMFLFTTGQDELRPLDPKNPEARWVARDAVAPLLTHPKDKEFFLGVLPSLQ
ncbi:MAG TPA: NUDIX domain-containing protein [Candidatus Binatia bacterium]|nr:NUDIX domain-containing protein [Candidatus Binatia bacterium]